MTLQPRLGHGDGESSSVCGGLGWVASNPGSVLGVGVSGEPGQPREAQLVPSLAVLATWCLQSTGCSAGCGSWLWQQVVAFGHGGWLWQVSCGLACRLAIGVVLDTRSFQCVLLQLLQAVPLCSTQHGKPQTPRRRSQQQY